MKNINLKPILKIAIVAAAAQIFFVVLGAIISLTFGAPPVSATQYFESFAQNKFTTFLRDDTYNMALIFMYIFTTCAMYALLYKHKFTMALYGLIFVIISVTIMITSQSAFPMMHLGEKFLSATSNIEKERLYAAGEAIMANNMWHSTSAFFSGILMQGGGVLITLAMIGSKRFSKATILAGLMCNGFDLINHLIHYNLPQVAKVFLLIAGPFYLVWYVSQIIDFKRNLKTIDKKELA